MRTLRSSGLALEGRKARRVEADTQTKPSPNAANKRAIRCIGLLRRIRGDVDLVHPHFNLVDQSLGHVFDASIAESHLEQGSAKALTLRLSDRRTTCFLPAKLQYSGSVAAHYCPADGNLAVWFR